MKDESLVITDWDMDYADLSQRDEYEELKAQITEVYGTPERDSVDWQACLDATLLAVYRSEVSRCQSHVVSPPGSETEEVRPAVLESHLRIAEQRLAIHLDRVDQRCLQPEYDTAFELAGKKLDKVSEGNPYADMFVLAHLGAGSVQLVR